MKGMGKAAQPKGIAASLAARQLPRPWAEMLRYRDCSACDSQLCATAARSPPLTTALSIIFLLLFCFFFFFLPSSFFDSLAVSPLAKIPSAQGRELRRADGGGCQPQPAPTAAAEKHEGCGLLFSTHSITETPWSSLKAAITKQVFSVWFMTLSQALKASNFSIIFQLTRCLQSHQLVPLCRDSSNLWHRLKTFFSSSFTLFIKEFKKKNIKPSSQSQED